MVWVLLNSDLAKGGWVLKPPITIHIRKKIWLESDKKHYDTGDVTLNAHVNDTRN